ncbi:MAG: hypothetical protein RR643_04845 [Anaerorhabdus sp.]|uniref:hypothetical protein n=1 Tax=Anaerorhabdus sp. TaxID=1872524 RepID=UPI002FCA4F53
MNYNQHLDLFGKHSFLSGSNYAWVNYSEEKVAAVWTNQQAKTEGTVLHDIASNLIVRRIKVAPLKKAFNMFVNDAIGFGMESEQILYYSDNCFGTADAILFKNNKLQIHDLKTGIHKASFNQLDIYTAMFCLEYGEDPLKIEVIHRIYQGKGYIERSPDPEQVAHIMQKIVVFDKIIDDLKYNQ